MTKNKFKSSNLRFERKNEPCNRNKHNYKSNLGDVVEAISSNEDSLEDLRSNTT